MDLSYDDEPIYVGDVPKKALAWQSILREGWCWHDKKFSWQSWNKVEDAFQLCLYKEPIKPY